MLVLLRARETPLPRHATTAHHQLAAEDITRFCFFDARHAMLPLRRFLRCAIIMLS